MQDDEEDVVNEIKFFQEENVELKKLDYVDDSDFVYWLLQLY